MYLGQKSRKSVYMVAKILQIAFPWKYVLFKEPDMVSINHQMFCAKQDCSAILWVYRSTQKYSSDDICALL